MTAIRAAITQTTWTVHKESMPTTRSSAREAKAQGAQVICFQELLSIGDQHHRDAGTLRASPNPPTGLSCSARRTCR